MVSKERIQDARQEKKKKIIIKESKNGRRGERLPFCKMRRRREDFFEGIRGCRLGGDQ